MKFSPPSKIIGSTVLIPRRSAMLAAKPIDDTTWLYLYRGRNDVTFTVINDTKGLYPSSEYKIVNKAEALEIFRSAQEHFEGFNGSLAEA